MKYNYVEEKESNSSDSCYDNLPIYSTYEKNKLLEEFLKTRDPLIKNKLIEANLRIVIPIAKAAKRINDAVDFDELVSIGFENLGKIIDSYNPSKGSFDNYLYICLKNCILNSLGGFIKNNDFINMSNLFNLANNQLIEIISIQKFIEIYKKENGSYPSIECIANSFDYKIENVQSAIDMLGGIEQLDDIDIACDDKKYLTIDDGSSKELMEYMNTHFTNKERQAVILKFGLFGNEPISNSEITKLLNITNQRLFQILNKAYRKLHYNCKSFKDMIESYHDRVLEDNISYVKRDECEGYDDYYRDYEGYTEEEFESMGINYR